MRPGEAVDFAFVNASFGRTSSDSTSACAKYDTRVRPAEYTLSTVSLGLW
jgi:hypothetical protein